MRCFFFQILWLFDLQAILNQWSGRKQLNIEIKDADIWISEDFSSGNVLI